MSSFKILVEALFEISNLINLYIIMKGVIGIESIEKI